MNEPATTPPHSDAPANQRGALVLAGVLVLVLPLVLFMGLGESKTDRVLSRGEPVAAVVLAVEDTGNRFNSNPQVVISLRVTPTEGEPYDAQVRKVATVVELLGYPVGAELDVRIDPEDRSRVAIVGPRSAPSPASADDEAE